MGVYNVRLSGFTEQDKDIIDVLDQLNSHHKLTEFITRLIRVYFDGTDFKGNLVDERNKALDAVGCYYNREKFFRDVESDVNSMREKIDMIYNMVYENYLLIMASKKAGLIEEKAENSLVATFILEKQLRDLKKTLGISDSQFVHASGRVDDIAERAESVMKYMINTYGELINELKEVKNVTVEQSVVEQPVVAKQTVKEVAVEKPVVHEVKRVEKAEVTEEIKNDEPIDFGDADMGALSKFLGM